MRRGSWLVILKFFFLHFSVACTKTQNIYYQRGIIHMWFGLVELTYFKHILEWSPSENTPPIAKTHQQLRENTTNCKNTPSIAKTDHRLQKHTTNCGKTPPIAKTHHQLRKHTTNCENTPSIAKTHHQLRNHTTNYEISPTWPDCGKKRHYWQVSRHQNIKPDLFQTLGVSLTICWGGGSNWFIKKFVANLV